MAAAEGTRTLRAGAATLTVDAQAGGRIAALEVDGLQLLVPRSADPLGWGCYPLAPWAGRLREARFAFGPRTWHVAPNLAPHAIHGTVYRRPWEWLADDTIGTAFGPDWPFPGRAEQRFLLSADALLVRLELQATEQPFPASAGFHPWFLRRLARGAEAELAFDARWRYANDAAGLPDGALVAPGEGPWDDCFTGLQQAPRIRWPGALEIEIASNHGHWVVYDRPVHALCVEPWTAPPNALNGAAQLVTPAEPLLLEMRIGWRAIG